MKHSSLGYKKLFTEIKQLIQSAKQRAAVAVNAELTLLYWQVGKCISNEILNEKRAEYGKRVIEDLACDLTNAFGKGWPNKTAANCLRSAETFPKNKDCLRSA